MKFPSSIRRGAHTCALFAALSPCLSIADQTIAGNLTVTGSASVAADANVGGNLDVEGNTLTLGNNAGNYGVGTFYLPSGSDGAGWRLTRLSAWLWEVDNAGTVAPAMRLDASNNLTLYSGSTAALTLNPSAQSLSLGSATLTADGTGLATNGAVVVGGALTATNYTVSNGAVFGGSTGLALNAGGTDQNITLSPSGSGNVIVNGNLGVGTATPGAKVDVAGNVRISSTSSALLGVGTPGASDNGAFDFFASPTVAATSSFPNIFAQFQIRAYSSVRNTTKPHVAGLVVANEVTSGGARSGLVVDVGTPASYSSSAGILRGVYSISTHAGSGAVGSVVGQLSMAANYSASGVAANLWGSRSMAFNGNSNLATSVTTNMAAAVLSLQNAGSSSVVSTAKGVDVENIYNSGTITDTYGVYVGDVTAGTQTNKPFSFYASDPDADNYFAGNVGIGTALPSVKLDVVGDVRFSGGVNGMSLFRDDKWNQAVGLWALFHNTTGRANLAIGNAAMEQNTVGELNTAVGASNLSGSSTLGSNISGNANVAFGHQALNANTSGSNNSAVGTYAGSQITTGSFNIAVGYNAQLPSPTADNQLSIGNWIYGVDGKIGIGTPAPAAKLHVTGATRFDGPVRIAPQGDLSMGEFTSEPQ